MKITIYQINTERDRESLAFRGLSEMKRQTGSEEPDGSIYDRVFDGEVDCEGLEDVYDKFNTDQPEGYEGRSLSVSDIVEVGESDSVTPGFYYCDTIGFSKVDFEPESAEPVGGEKIRVLMVEPGKKAYEKEIGTSLEDMYHALDCELIETFYPFDYEDFTVIVCDDEGKLNGSKPNRAIYGEDGKMIDIICGKFFICDCSTDNFKSLPDNMMEKYKKQFLMPEQFARVNGEIIAVKYDPERVAVR